MNRKLKVIASAMLITAAAASQSQAEVDTNTYTNVIENISVALTVYEQGATNADGTVVARDVHQLTTSFILDELALLNPGTNFKNAKLVASTDYFTNN
jgi:hypothetical protein